MRLGVSKLRKWAARIRRSYLSLKWQEETNYKCQIFFPSLYKIKRRCLLKFCDTWLLLHLTFLKPWANQCLFLMEMFVLSYVNVLSIYPRLCLKWVPPKGSEMTWQTSMLYSYIVLLIYVNETIPLYGNLPFFKIHVNHFMAQEDSPGAKVISKCILWVRDLLPSSEFWDISFL